MGLSSFKILMLVLASGVWLPICAAHAVDPDEVLKDAALEARARTLSAGLRCVVCQNQSIDDSDAPLAKDLRRLVRDRLKAGDSDSEVKAYIVDRYGTFVLLKPPFAPNTLLLWGLPFGIVLLAMYAAYRALFRARPEPVETESTALELSNDEQKRLEKILKMPNKDHT